MFVYPLGRHPELFELETSAQRVFFCKFSKLKTTFTLREKKMFSDFLSYMNWL